RHDRGGLKRRGEVGENGNPEPLGARLRRRRSGLTATTGGLVGTGEQEGDLVPRREPLEHGGAERSGRGYAELYRSSLRNEARAAGPRWTARCVVLSRTRSLRL